MDDLVERLRARYCSNCKNERGAGHQDDCLEAADALEAKDAEIERLRHEMNRAGAALSQGAQHLAMDILREAIAAKEE